MKLSDKTEKIIEALFLDEHHKEIKKLLLKDCSNNLPGCNDWSQEHLERVWFSVLKISDGSMEKLFSAIALAQTDYRDLFMCAGFGEVEAHKKWIL